MAAVRRCSGNCQAAGRFSRALPMLRVIAQAVGEAQARNAPSTIASSIVSAILLGGFE